MYGYTQHAGDERLEMIRKVEFFKILSTKLYNQSIWLYEYIL